MKMKLVTLATLIIILVGMLGMTFKVQMSEASGNIYIRADGSVDPVDAPILSVDNVTYTFIGSINGSIVVERDNIILDGIGYTIQGTGSGIGIDLLRRSNVTIKNMEIKAFSYSIQLFESSFCIISGNDMTNNLYGIRLVSSFDNSLSGNSITSNGFAVAFDSSFNNNITGNKITDNDYHSVYFYSSPDNTIRGNNITNNPRAIYFDYSSHNNIDSNNIIHNPYRSIRLYSSFNNTISRNKIIDSLIGIYLYSSHINTVHGNNVTNNNVGVQLYQSSGNKFYHNNLIDNTQQVYIETFGYANFWDEGYQSGGNYWSDYRERYPNASEIDGLGIWDTPYVMDADNRDNYPIIAEFPAFFVPPLFMITTLLVLVYRKKH
jgi:parallel beta-helix repeat protein